VPRNAVDKHRQLHETLATLRTWTETCPYNSVSGDGRLGVVAAGFTHRKLLDVVGTDPPSNFTILKLASIFPLPERRITRFLKHCREVLVLEENEPYLEIHIRAAAQAAGCTTRIVGKTTGHVRPREGELYRRRIQSALTAFVPGFSPARHWTAETEPLPAKENHCAGCRYDEIVDALCTAAAAVGQRPILVADPGCLVTVAERLDAKYAMGSAVGVADGISKAGTRERAVALFGDSSFFHTALPAVCNAVHNRSDILMVVIDNQATATTGFQPNPGVDADARGEPAPALDIERIARACGVATVTTARLSGEPSDLEAAFARLLPRRELALLIIRTDHAPYGERSRFR
jgi:indolepyruvate ferredoxin oxidoreductase alpha subunit